MNISCEHDAPHRTGHRTISVGVADGDTSVDPVTKQPTERNEKIRINMCEACLTQVSDLIAKIRASPILRNQEVL